MRYAFSFEGGSFGMSSDGDSRGRDDQDMQTCGEKQEDLAEDLSFPTPTNGTSKYHQ